MSNRIYGWKPDLPDARDYKYRVPPRVMAALPPMVDLRPGCGPVLDQGSLGSCTANAIGSAHQFGQIKQAVPSPFIPSRLFIYYNEREMEGSINQDAGAYIRDGMKSVANQGVCPETQWPYDVSRFTVKPNADCYSEALKHQVVSYWRVDQTLDTLKGCLAEGYPVVFGFTVYDSFESSVVSRTGEAPMPGPNERVLGGHAVKAVGYDDATRRFRCKNSWSTSWGDQGYFTLPYEYLTNSDLSADFWTVRLVEVDDVNPNPPEPPKPKPLCDWPWLLPAATAFVDGAIGEADKRRSVNVTPTSQEMIEGGLRGLQAHLQRIQKVQGRQG
jgi:C1A family cysteine protease